MIECRQVRDFRIAYRGLIIMNIEPKPKKSSKTLWANGTLFVIGVLNLLLQQPIIPLEWLPYIAGLAIPLLNVVLRFVTKEPVESLFS